MTTITVPRLKPRNPLVAACHQRRAGVHGPRDGGRRQSGKRELQAELRDWQRQRPPP
jgi:hypothetical protein